MHNSTDIYISGIKCTKPRIDDYVNTRVHVGKNEIPDDVIVARVEKNQLIIMENSNNKTICGLLNINNDNNYFNLDVDGFRHNLIPCMNRMDNFIWQDMKSCSTCPVLWNIRNATLYLIKDRIKLCNGIPQLDKYLVDEDLYDIVKYVPTKRSICFTGTKNRMLVEVYDEDDELMNVAFNLDHQSKTHIETLLNKISSFDKKCIEDIEFICENYLGAVFKKKGNHNPSGIEYLLTNHMVIFNSLYRISMRCLRDKELLQ